jgi:L-ribulokinase
MKETYVIGIDYGTDSVRALLVDAATGETIADSVFSYPRWGRQEYCSPAEACFRQHPQDYLDGLRHVIGEVVAARPDAAPHIRAVSVDTTASTPCLVDRTCTPLALRPEYADDPDAMFVLWKDHTAQREAEEIILFFLCLFYALLFLFFCIIVCFIVSVCFLYASVCVSKILVGAVLIIKVRSV